MSVESQRRATGARSSDLATSASGIVFAVLAFVAFLLTGRPEEKATGDEIVQFFSDKQTETEWQILLFGLAAVAFLVFASRLAELAGGGRTGSLLLAGATASSALFLAGACAFGALAAAGDDASPALFDLGDLAFGLASFTAAVFVAGAASALLDTANAWLGQVGMALAALLVVNGCVRAVAGGDGGATLGTISYVVFLAWVLVVSALVALRRAP